MCGWHKNRDAKFVTRTDSRGPATAHGLTWIAGLTGMACTQFVAHTGCSAGIVPRNNQASPLSRRLTNSSGREIPPGFLMKRTRQPVGQFGLDYDDVGGHGWYKNLEPTVAQLLATLRPGDLLVDYSSGTGILTRRLLERISYPVGILNVDASTKFLRVALESFRDDPRVAFRLLRWLRRTNACSHLTRSASRPAGRRGADAITSTNAIHLYYDLDETLASWARLLHPGGLAFVCSGNMRNPNARPGEWIIDETVASHHPGRQRGLRAGRTRTPRPALRRSPRRRRLSRARHLRTTRPGQPGETAPP